MTVAILGQGAMGSAVGAELVRSGLTVLTPLEGRSVASRHRAMAAGIADASWETAARADIILSIVPPSMAVAAAQSIASVLPASGAGSVYVDLNAVNPETVATIARIIEPTGTALVDGSIIGLPPGIPGRRPPTLYVSGPEANRVLALDGRGIVVSVLQGKPVGAASALKMCYGGLTKGLIALGTGQLLAADRAGVGEALMRELGLSQRDLLNGFRKSIPDMLPKAARWISEMEEIAAFIGPDRPEAGFFRAAAGLYEAIAADVRDEGVKAGVVTALLQDRPGHE